MERNGTVLIQFKKIKGKSMKEFIYKITYIWKKLDEDCKSQYKNVGFGLNNFVGKPTFLFSLFYSDSVKY